MTGKDKYVYLFEEADASMKELLGGKGANLAEMTRIGLPVPPGFTVSTDACKEYYNVGEKVDENVREEILIALEKIEEKTGKKLGSTECPLLLSVRSGAVFSMPGMMDTVLNLGLNDETVEGLARVTGDRRFSLDCYRRFIQMFSDVVLKVGHFSFEEALDEHKKKRGIESDVDLNEEDMEIIIEQFKKIVAKEKGAFPQDPVQQLMQAIEAVFASWNNQRAKVYRKINKIPAHLGTAVNVQSMVFGNLGNDSGTGVAFTRNPSTGEKKLYGEYLVNAQGEDVVAGIRTPQPISELQKTSPAIYDEFLKVCDLLEAHYRNIQDIEFTFEKGKLYMLQTRNGKRTAAAAVKIAVDMVQEGVLSKEEAITRVEPGQLDHLLHRRIDPTAKLVAVATGLPASLGAASGQVVFDADEAEILSQEGGKVILVRPETTPDDIHGIIAAQGVLTSRGGMTSHAAVVARGMGKPCVSGCEVLEINVKTCEIKIKNSDMIIKKSDMVSIDGSSGTVMIGEVPLIDPQLSGEFKQLLEWADEIRRLKVRANADTPEDAIKAREFGAEGIGLCRTEHMFMAQDRLPVVQEMILASNEESRIRVLDRLLPMQQEDFKGIFSAMKGLPVTIRLLDPPLHEFLPDLEELIIEYTELRVSGATQSSLVDKEQLIKLVKNLTESNPMLGHRGCRLGLVYPEIYEMQCRAIFRATVELINEGMELEPEVMVPLVGHSTELEAMREMIDKVAAQIMAEERTKFKYKVGTMIELPRACVTAGEIAKHADFFSFGTNDLTQTTLGYSRDDAEGKFLQYYQQNNIIPDNPFAILDQEGVGELVKMAVEKGKGTKENIKLGICGEHGGDPSSIDFCHQLGLDYVSCSPFRVPIARLAAAQSKVNNK